MKIAGSLERVHTHTHTISLINRKDEKIKKDSNKNL